MSTRFHYYRRYCRDFLAGEQVTMMTLEEEGAYTRLLDYCWIQGSIPDDTEKLSRMCRITPERMADMWPSIRPCFDVEMGSERLSTSWMEVQRDKVIETSAVRRQAANARWYGEDGSDASA